MLTKYILHINGTDYELRDDDLYNWEDILCAYKRIDLGGLVRSFSSEFVFVNRAREIILEAYLKDRFNLTASITVMAINDRWIYEERFTCPLDLGKLTWDAYTLTVSCVDTSLSAMIKANKSTKYEFAIGEQLTRDAILNYDRLPMKNSATYSFTQGTTYENLPDIWVEFEKDTLPHLGSVNSELIVNGFIELNEDQEYKADSYILKAHKNISVEMDYQIEWRTDTSDGRSVALSLDVYRKGALVSSGVNGQFINLFTNIAIQKGSHPTPDDLPAISSIPENERPYTFATVNDIVWILKHNQREYYSWVSTGKSIREYFSIKRQGKINLELIAGDIVRISAKLPNSNNTASIRIIESKFTFQWFGKGETVNLDLLDPKHVAKELLNKVTEGKLNIDVVFSDFDTRLANTFLLAAESARGLAEAKFYSSLDDFFGWMSTVFGYTYSLGERIPSHYKKIQECGEYEFSPWSFIDTIYVGSVNCENIIYFPKHNRFLYYDTIGKKLYSQWEGSTDYNDEFGHPRTDTLFRIKELSDTDLFYFDEYTGTELLPRRYEFPVERFSNDTQTVYFKHRSEILRDDAPVRVIRNCRGLFYCIEESLVYSTVTAGYEKKDYDSINGRDEFNFSNAYSTGCNVTTKTLSLISKYRADCYGIEFAVQKRGADTTDDSSDNDVFFLLCTEEDGKLVPDRTTAKVENAISDKVFNGAFSPMACIRANAGYIGIQDDVVHLTFASSTGNSDIIIDDVPVSSDITLDTPLATCASIRFNTDQISDYLDFDELIEVRDGGLIYRGFIRDLDLNFPTNESSDFQLIVKEIEPCS